MSLSTLYWAKPAYWSGSTAAASGDQICVLAIFSFIPRDSMRAFQAASPLKTASAVPTKYVSSKKARQSLRVHSTDRVTAEAQVIRSADSVEARAQGAALIEAADLGNQLGRVRTAARDVVGLVGEPVFGQRLEPRNLVTNRVLDEVPRHVAEGVAQVNRHHPLARLGIG